MFIINSKHGLVGTGMMKGDTRSLCFQGANNLPVESKQIQRKISQLQTGPYQYVEFTAGQQSDAMTYVCS